MAELVKLPVESAELGAILAELPQDDKWDLEIPLERGYSKAGLVRYHLEGVKALTSTKAEEPYSEQLSQSKQGAVQKVAGGPKLELVNVKAENPLHDKLQAKIQVAESGKGALEKIYSQSQDVCLELHAKLSIDPAFKAKFHEMETMCSNLGDKIKNVRETVFKAKALQPDKVTQEELENFCAHVENWSTLLDVAKSQVRKANQLLSN